MRLTVRLTLNVALAVAIGLSAAFGLAGILLVEQTRDAEAREATVRMAGVREEVDAGQEALGLSAAALGQIAIALFSTPNATAANGTGSDPAFAAALFHAHDIDAMFFAWDPAVNLTALLAAQPQSQQQQQAGFAMVDGLSGFRLAANGTMVPTDAVLNDAVRALRLDRIAPFGVDSDLLRAGGQVWAVGAVGLAGLFPLPEGSPPFAFSLVAARQLDAAYIAGLETGSGLDLRLEPPTLGAGDAAVRIHRPDWDTLVAATPLRDAAGQPVGELVAHEPRVAFAQALESMLFFFVVILAICGILLAVGLVLLHRNVSGPLVRLERRMRGVADRASPRHPMPAAGDDEVSSLSNQFDAMMAALDERTGELEESNADLRSFAAVVSHDLKNPLSTFKVNLHLLAGQAEAAGNAKDLERIRRMSSSVDRMESRIDGILAYAKSRGGHVPLARVPLGPVVEGVLQDLDADIQRRKAKVEVGELPTVVGEAGGLAQVLQNLLANALKFHKPGESPAVRIRAERGPVGWLLHVEDDGVGFTADEAATLFKPFTRLGNASHVDGQGIGLASCARILERMGGRIEAAGAPGSGARFTIHLAEAGQSAEGDPAPA